VPDDVLARVFGVIQFLWISTFGLGGLLAVPLVDWLGADGALIVAGAFLPVLALLTGAKLLRLDAAAEAPGAELSLLRSIPIFAPLPGTPLEHLAARLLPLRVDAGTVIVKQGDSGDRFYVVAEGEVDVSVDGARVSEPGRAATSARSRSSATCRARRPRPRGRMSCCMRSSARTSWLR